MTRGTAAAEAFPESVARLRAALGDTPAAGRFWPALSALDWAAALPSSAAPGFVYLAGAVDGLPVGGGGRDLLEAAGRLAGEASEALAQASPGEAADLPGDPAIDEIWGGGPRMPAVNLVRGRLVGAPMASVRRDTAASGPIPPRGLGLAAGPDREAARLAAVLELVERDAAARWWCGESRPRAIDAALAATAAADLAAMREGSTASLRPTAFLALASPVGLPVACAFSLDPGARGGLVVGLKAALGAATAIGGAVRELLQMEIALEIARMRAAQGRETAHDSMLLRRAALDPDAHAAFAALPPEGAAPQAPADLSGLVAHLAGLGLETTIADLGGPEAGLRVAKAFVPGLRPLPDPRAPAARPGAPAAHAELL